MKIKPLADVTDFERGQNKDVSLNLRILRKRLTDLPRAGLSTIQNPGRNYAKAKLISTERMIENGTN